MTVPRKEKTAIMNVEGVVDVRTVVPSVSAYANCHRLHLRHKIVKSIPYSGVLFSWKVLGLLLHAKDGIGILDPLSARQLPPVVCQTKPLMSQLDNTNHSLRFGPFLCEHSPRLGDKSKSISRLITEELTTDSKPKVTHANL